MATATSSPTCEPDWLHLGNYTPKNLARGARAALLRDSSPVEVTDIGEQQHLPIDITDAANQLADEQVAVYNAKLKVFRTFCAPL
ncbi:hypothetical protein ED733_000551 [Metarhizium rileyi]|uniref:Uncharacterized protein n=1 Tax=Metarhizium rileyi (strain RCEF 4871) TaxID=1649241 RepID=A0A5C6G4G6_METRR|nr:hypothetical protein ED733_000551 [Metarhizium rileyi]